MARMVLPCADGALCCNIGSGTVPGNTIAGPWFLAAYHPCLDTYLQGVQRLAITAICPELQQGLADLQQDESAQLPGLPPVPSQMDVSLTSYANDVARTMRDHASGRRAGPSQCCIAF